MLRAGGQAEGLRRRLRLRISSALGSTFSARPTPQDRAECSLV